MFPAGSPEGKKLAQSLIRLSGEPLNALHQCYVID